MIVLGINPSHNGTACLLKDGEIIYCISEERLTRVKNQGGVPYNSINRILKESKTKPNQIDFVAFSFKDMAINTGFSVLDSNSSYSTIWKLKEIVLGKLPILSQAYIKAQKYYYESFLHEDMKDELLSEFQKKTKISKERVKFVDHHTAHAYTAFLGDTNVGKKRLVFTLDAMGDGLCATVSIAKEGKLKRISSTPMGNSLGDLYAYVTSYLGMKRGEHEYKVMGLAAYANPKYVDTVYQKIKDWIIVDKDSLEFKSKYFSHTYYQHLDKVFKGERFDNISGAIQKLVEVKMSEWVEASVKKTGIKDIACAGGVFMNVKANQKLSELDCVKSMFIFPSGGDESTAIGAAYYYAHKNGDSILPIQDLYLGLGFSDRDISKALKQYQKKYRIKKYANIERTVASLISKRNVVARFAGRMEWGARALGNRSIITHPQNLEGVRDINEQIKNRDFWMPFAPSVLSEKLNKYVVNKKKISSLYMILGFDTTKIGSDSLRAAIHQYDFTARPQEVKKEHNLKYHRLISYFEKKTGIGAVLNTSFNLHGFPIVCSPEDAIYVFENSGLQYLALGDYLVQKTSK